MGVTVTVVENAAPVWAALEPGAGRVGGRARPVAGPVGAPARLVHFDAEEKGSHYHGGKEGPACCLRSTYVPWFVEHVRE